MAVSRARAMDKVEPALNFIKIPIEAPKIGLSNTASGGTVKEFHMRIAGLDIKRGHVRM